MDSEKLNDVDGTELNHQDVLADVAGVDASGVEVPAGEIEGSGVPEADAQVTSEEDILAASAPQANPEDNGNNTTLPLGHHSQDEINASAESHGNSEEIYIGPLDRHLPYTRYVQNKTANTNLGLLGGPGQVILGNHHQDMQAHSLPGPQQSVITSQLLGPITIRAPLGNQPNPDATKQLGNIRPQFEHFPCGPCVISGRLCTNNRNRGQPQTEGLCDQCLTLDPSYHSFCVSYRLYREGLQTREPSRQLEINQPSVPPTLGHLQFSSPTDLSMTPQSRSSISSALTPPDAGSAVPEPTIVEDTGDDAHEDTDHGSTDEEMD